MTTPHPKSPPRVMVTFNDALRAGEDQLLSAAEMAKTPHAHAVTNFVTLFKILAQISRHDTRVLHKFLGWCSTIQMVGRCTYLSDIFVLKLAGETVPTTQEVADECGVTKQAVSKEITDALARVRKVDPGLAEMLEDVRLACVTEHTPVTERDNPALALDTKMSLPISWINTDGTHPALVDGELMRVTFTATESDWRGTPRDIWRVHVHTPSGETFTVKRSGVVVTVDPRSRDIYQITFAPGAVVP